MRWVMLTVCVLCGAVWFAGCGGDADEGPAEVAQPVPARRPAVTIIEEKAARVLLEAEEGTVKAPVEVFEKEGVSGGKYVLAPEGPEYKEINIGGHVMYRFEVVNAGGYSLWLRTRFSGACGNSLGVMLDGQGLGTVEDAVYDKWHWVPLRGARVELKEGSHVLVISNREDGAAWDQVLLTTDEEYRPGGIEKNEG